MSEDVEQTLEASLSSRSTALGAVAPWALTVYWALTLSFARGADVDDGAKDVVEVAVSVAGYAGSAVSDLVD